MPGHHEVQFPSSISYGSRGGPGFKTEIVVVDSGAEERVGRWNNAKRSYNVAYGIKSREALSELQKFFIARRGAENSFRFKDWLDFNTAADGQSGHSATDEKVVRESDGGVDGDGTETRWQLVKRYTSGGVTRTRAIEKPVGNTVRVAIDGKEIAARYGTATTANVAGTTLFDSTAQFQSWGVQAGLTVTNQTDGSTAVITNVVSETELELSGGLSGGAEDDFDLDDEYVIADPVSVNSTTGLLTFTVAPSAASVVTAGCEFDVPVRFGDGADDALQASIDDFSSGAISSIPLVEVIGSQPVDEEFSYGGGKRYTISANVSITQLQGRVHVIAASGAGLKVALPDTASVPAGGPHFYVKNAGGTHAFDVTNASGVTIVSLAAGDACVLICEDTEGAWYALKGS